MAEIWLDGMDYSAAFLAWLCRKTPGGANHFVIVLESEQPFSGNNIEKLFQSIPDPVLKILSSRMGHHPLHAAPCLRLGPARMIQLREMEISPEDLLNEKLPKRTAVEAVFYHNKLIFKFDHRLFDGRGAELFLKALALRDFESVKAPFGEPGPHLNEWKKQFTSGNHLQHRLMDILAQGPIAGFSGFTEKSPVQCRMISLSQEKTRSIQSMALEKAGPYMMTPFLLAHAAQTLKPYLQIPGNIVVPMSVDIRKNNEIFLNHWGIASIFAKESSLETLESSIKAFRSSFMDNLGSHSPEDYACASRLSRIAPFRLMKHCTEKLNRSITGSFMFSCLTESALSGLDFAGSKIQNLYHIPAMPPVCGCGIFVNFFGSVMNISISARKGALTSVDELASAIEKGLCK